MTRVLLVDNYDSFTHNLDQLLGSLGAEVVVRRNDAVTVEEAERIAPTHVVISPGPGRPEDARGSLDLIRHYSGRRPLLGVCLGHQAIGLLHDATIGRASRIMHGKVSEIRHEGRGLFKSLPNPFRATRYHSLVVRAEGLPPSLEVTARSDDGEIMGLQLKNAAVHGLQFHPESFRSEAGAALLRNFLDS